MKPEPKPKPGVCGYRDDVWPNHPATCQREKGHTGMHIEFRPNITVAFGNVPAGTISEQELQR